MLAAGGIGGEKAMEAHPPLITRPGQELSTRQVRSRLGISQERLARVLDVSSRTIERWEKRDEIPSNKKAIERLGKLSQIAELGEIDFGRDAFQRFMKLPQPIFDGLTTWEMIERGEADRVLSVLSAEYEGIGF
jgi:DNA-binding XRE family transcriptional regulator